MIRVTQLHVFVYRNTGCVDRKQAKLMSQVRWEALPTKLALAASS